MYLTPAPETAVYCIPATVQRKGPRFPGNVCPEGKMRTKEAEAEEEEEEEEGSHRGSLVGGGPAMENWMGERKQPSRFSRTAANVTRSSGLVSLVGCCHHFF